jgi:hypothetical protein
LWNSNRRGQTLCSTILVCNFFASNIIAFFSTVWNPHEFLHFCQVQIFDKKRCWGLLALFETLRPNQPKCLGIFLYTNIPVNPFHFLKKYGNPCTLIYMQWWAQRSVKLAVANIFKTMVRLRFFDNYPLELRSSIGNIICGYLKSSWWKILATFNFKTIELTN